MVARSATKALTNTILPWVLELVQEGIDNAIAQHAMLRRGTYLHHGRCAMPSLCESFGLDYQPVGEA
jgi:alanine dehydrogenase